MAGRETDFYGVFEGEGRVAQLFRVRWVDNPNVEGPGPYPRFEQLDHKHRWVQNNRLIGTIGGHGGSDADVWKISVEDAKRVAGAFGVEHDAPTAGYIGRVDEAEERGHAR